MKLCLCNVHTRTHAHTHTHTQHRGNSHHMNVELAWEQDVIGRGAVVSILDDGLEHTHPDLRDSYVSIPVD